jgi:hypothetical protein
MMSQTEFCVPNKRHAILSIHCGLNYCCAGICVEQHKEAQIRTTQAATREVRVHKYEVCPTRRSEFQTVYSSLVYDDIIVVCESNNTREREM